MTSNKKSKISFSEAEFAKSQAYRCDSIPDDYQLPGWNESEKLQKIKIFVASNKDRIKIPTSKDSMGTGYAPDKKYASKIGIVSWQQRLAGSVSDIDEEGQLQPRNCTGQSMNACDILRRLQSLRRKHQGSLQKIKHLPPGDITCYLQALKSERNYQMNDNQNLILDDPNDNLQPTLCKLKDKVNQLEMIYAKLDNQVQSHQKYPKETKDLKNNYKSKEFDHEQFHNRLAEEKTGKKETLTSSKIQTENLKSNEMKSISSVNSQLKSQIKVLHNEKNKLKIAHSKEIKDMQKKQKEMEHQCDHLLKQNTKLKTKMQSQMQEKRSCVEQGLMKNNAELKSIQVSLKKELKDCKQQNIILEKKLLEKSHANKVMEKNIWQSKKDMGKYQKMIDKLKRQQDLARGSETRKHSSLQNKTNDDIKSASKEDDNEKAIISLKNDLKQVTNERDELKQQVKSIMKNTMKMEQTISVLQITLQKAEDRKRALVSEIDKTKASTAKIEEEKELLQKQMKELETKNEEIVREMSKMRNVRVNSNDEEVHPQTRSGDIKELGINTMTTVNESKILTPGTTESLQDHLKKVQQELTDTQSYLKLSENKAFLLSEENKDLKKLVNESKERYDHLQHVQKEYNKLTLENGSKTLKLQECEEYINILKKRIDGLQVKLIVQAESKNGYEGDEKTQNHAPISNEPFEGRQQAMNADDTTRCKHQDLEQRYNEIRKILIEVERASDAKVAEPEYLDPSTFFSSIHTAFLNRDDRIHHLSRINQELRDEVGSLKNKVNMLNACNRNNNNNFNDSGYDCMEHPTGTSSHALESLDQASGIPVKDKSKVEISKRNADYELVDRDKNCNLQLEKEGSEGAKDANKAANEKDTMPLSNGNKLESQDTYAVLLTSQKTSACSTTAEDPKKRKSELDNNQLPTEAENETNKNFKSKTKSKKNSKGKAKVLKPLPELPPIRGTSLSLLKHSLLGPLLPLPSPAKIDELMKRPTKGKQAEDKVLQGKQSYQEKRQEQKTALEEDDIKRPNACSQHHMKIKEKLKLDEEGGDDSDIAEEDLNDLINEILLN